MAKETTARTSAADSKAVPVEAARTAASVDASAKADAKAIADATAPVSAEKRTADGGKGAGPKSALKGGEGSLAKAGADATKKLSYSVQIHTDAKGLEVFEPIEADSGDDAARQALAKKNYAGASVRGVQPYSDPDANSLGGERDAAIMVGNALNDGHLINTLGTDANAEATRELAKADVKDLGE